MSWDIALRSDPCSVCNRASSLDYDGNFTYNYSPALDALGVPDPKELHGQRAGNMIGPLESALSKLLADPDKYGGLIRGDGAWGTADTLTIALRNLLNACKKYPNAVMETMG